LLLSSSMLGSRPGARAPERREKRVEPGGVEARDLRESRGRELDSEHLAKDLDPLPKAFFAALPLGEGERAATVLDGDARAESPPPSSAREVFLL